MHGRVIEDRAGALQTLLGHARPGAVRRLPPAEAIGLVLADEVCAACAVPEVASSMRDGYALRASDIASATTRSPVTLPLGGCLPAETELPEPLGDGRTIRVLTGAPLPPGADCVVADERVSLISDGVVFVAHTSPGRHVRPAGMDLPLGTRIVGAGERVTPQLAAILVRARLVQVPVFPSPTAAAFSIGNELADPYVPSADGRMPADNLVMTTGLLGQAGLETLRRAVLPDRVQDVVAALTREPYPDLIVTTGGTGRSERDVARTGAELAGFTPLFGSVDIRPGKGLFAAVRGETLLLGIPGPPGAVFSCLHAFLPALAARLRGLPVPEPVLARVQSALVPHQDGEWIVPCEYRQSGGLGEVSALVGSGLPSLLELARASGVLVVPPTGPIAPGDLVEYLALNF